MTQRLILEQVQSGALSALDAYARIAARDAPAPPPQAQEVGTPTAALPASAIAIIGMSGRFPGAPGLDEFWRLLAEGRSAITEVPARRWNAEELYHADSSVRGRSYARRGGFVDGIDEFDARFFRINPREALFLDPQQRVFMQECWRAFEHAGYSDRELAGSRCGVFVGCKSADYQLRLASQDTASFDATDSHLFGGNDVSMLPARIAYFLDLRGPALPINTACSSSLVALHIA